MSRTKGKNDPDRPKLDFYETPEWAIRAIIPTLSFLVPEPKRILDPGAGRGAITRVLHNRWPTAEIFAVEKQEEFQGELLAVKKKSGSGNIHISNDDFLNLQTGEGYFDLCVCNPPYTGSMGEDLALEFVKKARQLSRISVFLLRLHWLASQRRAKWFHADGLRNMPFVAILSKRPSFRGKGTDAAEYAWMIWADKLHVLRRIHLHGRWDIIPPPSDD